MASRVAQAGLACAVALGLLTGCGGGGGGGEGLPTRSPGVSPTRTPESPTRSPIRSSEPTREQSDEPTSGPTRDDTTQPPPQETQSPEEPAADEGQSDEEGVPAGVWWLLVAVLLVAGVVAWVLVARSRRRGAWQSRLQEAEAEVAWLARELLPQLRRAGSLDRATGGWQVAAPRVAAAEDQLTVLESSAPSVAEGARSRELRDAVRQARARMEKLTNEGRTDLWALDVDDAMAGLEAALAHPQTVAR